MWKRVLAIGLLALGVAGCSPRAVAVPATTTPPVRSMPAAPADRLYLAGGFASAEAAAGRSGWVILNAADPAHEQDIPAGVPSPDWSTIYTVHQTSGATTVQAVDLASGRVAQSVSIAGTYALPDGGSTPLPGGLSPNGQWLALQHLPTDAEQVAYARDRQWQSQFIVLPTSFAQPPRQIDLKGNFTVDAVSDDGTSLYLIESVPNASVPDQYRVRLYDVPHATLQPGVVADKSGDNLMSGIRHAAVATPDGQWLFSLYLNTQSGPFIHALNLTNRYALCIDLPLTAQEQKAKTATWSLTLTPDGKTLYVANGELGLVSAIDTDTLHVVKTTRFAVGTAASNPLQALARWAMPSAEAKGMQGGSALTPDGRTLYVLGDYGLVGLSTADLTLRSHQFATWMLASVAVSPDGHFLYLLRADNPAIAVVDARTGSVSGTLATGVIPFSILHVAPPVAP